MCCVKCIQNCKCSLNDWYQGRPLVGDNRRRKLSRVINPQISDSVFSLSSFSAGNGCYSTFDTIKEAYYHLTTAISICLLPCITFTHTAITMTKIWKGLWNAIFQGFYGHLYLGRPVNSLGYLAKVSGSKQFYELQLWAVELKTIQNFICGSIFSHPLKDSPSTKSFMRSRPIFKKNVFYGCNCNCDRLLSYHQHHHYN